MKQDVLLPTPPPRVRPSLTGVLRIAFFMLYRDRMKYLALVGGLAFTTLLVLQQLGGFCGIMLLTTSTIRMIGADIWVMDENVSQANEVIPMRSIEVQRVKSVAGVEWAVPLFWGLVEVQLANGVIERMQLVGLDDSSLVGHPSKMLAGSVANLWRPDAILVDQVAVERFGKRGASLGIGTVFEVNDQRLCVEGLCHTDRSFSGYPYGFTTYERAIGCQPLQRKMLSFVLAKADPDLDAEEVARRIDALPGLRALTKEDFSRSTMRWFFENTGIPLAFGIVVVMGLFVGLSVTGLIFLMFVNDNLRHLAAMKAMGASTQTLAIMVGVQAGGAGLIGYGLGLAFASLYAAAIVPREVPAFFVPWQVPLVVALLVGGVCFAAALVGVWRLSRLEAATVFK